MVAQEVGQGGEVAVGQRRALEDVLGAFGNPVLNVLGALLLAIATISVNIPANIISPAYDLTNLLPRVLTFRRGAYIAIAAAFLTRGG